MNLFSNYKVIGLVMLLFATLIKAEDETRACPPFLCSPFKSCLKVEQRLQEIRADLDECCSSLLAKCEIIRTKVGDPCDQAIPIDQAFMDTATSNPITQSGVYCLTETVTGSLVIDADNVIILLNNFSITASSNAISVTGHKDIAILGFGIITAGDPNGILFTNCSNVIVDNVSFEENVTGLGFDNVQGIRVNALSFSGHTTAAVSFANGSRNGKITCVNIFNNSASSGIDINNSSNLVFDTCRYCNNNTGATLFRGFHIRNNSSNCNFINCYANNNTTTMGDSRGFIFNTVTDCYCFRCESNANQNSDNTSNLEGFFVTDATKIIFDSCIALNNNTGVNNISGRGFAISNSEACCIFNSAAKQNSTDGFVLTNTCNNCYLNQNVAIANTDNGFSWDTAGNNVFLGNYAEANGANYTGILGPISTFDISVGDFITSGTPSIWQNIDVVL